VNFSLSKLKYFVIVKFLLKDCYSTREDIACQIGNVGNSLDKIFFQGGCKTIETICAGKGFSGFNSNFCFNTTANVQVPINEVITRTLSAEEFY
jgi:hypothetical protein